MESIQDSTLYTPLDESRSEIRLLTLHDSTTDEDGIECNMFKATVSDDFVTLSYVWGDPTDTEEIRVNGTPFQATKNLVALLHQLRKRDDWFSIAQEPSRTKSLPSEFGFKEKKKGSRQFMAAPFWADAICINQSDKRERSSQVAMIKQLYQSAIVNFSWLGPEAQNSDAAMCAFSLFDGELSQLELDPDPAWLERHVDILGKATIESVVPNLVWMAVMNVFARPYWQRVWTFQEAVLPQRVHVLCGSMSCSLDSVLNLCAWLRKYPRDRCPISMEPELWQALKYYTHNVSSLTLMLRIIIVRRQLHTTYSRKTLDDDFITFIFATDLRATDPRDFIYGILGVLDLPIHPDYEKSVKLVFTEITRVGFKLGYFNEILLLSGMSEAEGSQRQEWCLPSWVPEWSNLHAEYHISHPSHGAEKTSKDSSRTPWIADDHSLRAPGVVSDVVISTGAALSKENFHAQVCRFLHEMGSTTQYTTGIPNLQAIFRVIVSDRQPETRQQLESSGPSNESLFLGMLEHLVGISRLDDGMSIQQCLAELGIRDGANFAVSFEAGVLGKASVGKNRRPYGSEADALRGKSSLAIVVTAQLLEKHGMKFFRTQNGYLGLGPSAIMAGDSVCLLSQCRTPVLLRKKEDYHLHVGTCFVLGLTDWESSSGTQGSEKPWEIFEIH